MYLKEIARDNVDWIDLSEEGQMAGSCERYKGAGVIQYLSNTTGMLQLKITTKVL